MAMNQMVIEHLSTNMLLAVREELLDNGSFLLEDGRDAIRQIERHLEQRTGLTIPELKERATMKMRLLPYVQL